MARRLFVMPRECYNARMTPFAIKHEKFEGPLEVLLNLIEEKKLHVSDVALSRVTDDFLHYVKGCSDFPLAEGAQFAYVASTLLLIKSKALLPQLSLSEEEQGSIEDLERRLKLLQRFRELSRHLRARLKEMPLYLPRERAVVAVFAPPKRLPLSRLLEVLRSALLALPKQVALSKVTVKRVISLGQMIENLKNRILSTLRMSFKEFSAAHKGERVNVIVGFLAMLELAKQGFITVAQETPHGTIMMETEKVETPRYD